MLTSVALTWVSILSLLDPARDKRAVESSAFEVFVLRDFDVGGMREMRFKYCKTSFRNTSFSPSICLDPQSYISYLHTGSAKKSILTINDRCSRSAIILVSPMNSKSLRPASGPSDKGWQEIRVGIALTVLAITAVVLRFVARIKRRLKIEIDDWFALAGLVCLFKVPR